jgi:hypothetical protein
MTVEIPPLSLNYSETMTVLFALNALLKQDQAELKQCRPQFTACDQWGAPNDDDSDNNAIESYLLFIERQQALIDRIEKHVGINPPGGLLKYCSWYTKPTT